MKSLNEFITESHKQYTYRIKVAGEFPAELHNKFKAAMDMFKLDTCTGVKKTPVQSSPTGFPGLENQAISIFDMVFDYPASIDQIREQARIAGIDLNMLVVVERGHDDSMNAEADEQAREDDKVRLDTPEYPENTKEHTAAKDAYADSYQKAAKEFAGEADTDFEIAGEKTKPAQYNTDAKSGGDTSPMSKVKRLSLKDIIK